MLIGTNKENIINVAGNLLRNPTLLAKMSKVCFPYGNGYASQKIVHILEESILCKS